jgi:hypothetical protein
MDDIDDITDTEQLICFIVPTVYSITMYTMPLYLDGMPLEDSTIFVPENKADISFFGSGIEKGHIYQTDGGSNTYCSKTGAVGRICKEVTHVSCDNLTIFK